MSNLISLRQSSEKISDKVAQLTNKVQERGLLEKAGRAAGGSLRCL